MRVLIALGGNALARRGQAITVAVQRANISRAIDALDAVADANELIVTHGNGPQVGLLSLQAAALAGVEASPLDVLDAESEGMIGYLLEAEFAGRARGRSTVTVLTMTEVDRDDPAFAAPTKPVGPMYAHAEAVALAHEHGWVVARDGAGWRRVVASPRPLRIVQLEPIRCLVEAGHVVIAAGGGGIPVVRGPDGGLTGVEAVVDKDAASAVLARALGVDRFVLATDVPAVYLDWGTEGARAIRRAHPDALAGIEFAAGSMGPKVTAACEFVRATGRPATIGPVDDVAALVAGVVGTEVDLAAPGVVLGEPGGRARAVSAP